MENNDILYQAAKIFEEIKSYKIEITIGRKSQAEVFTIVFDDSDFHHLAGLHKLTDIVQVYKQNASIVFSKILKREICLSDLEASSFYTLIQDRISILLSLKELFFNINSVFKFRKIMIPNSRIKWTYLLEFTYNDTDSGYLFLEEYRAKPTNYVCVSNFKKNIDYGLGQIKYTLLQAKAINKISEEEELWYKNPAYKE